MSPPTSPAKLTLLYLEHYPELGGTAQRIPLTSLPFRIGRNVESDFVVYSRQVSKDHAEIVAAGDGLVLRDLNSTNGTYVNGLRISEAKLRPGDILHVAHKEFRFDGRPADPEEGGATDPILSNLPLSLIHGSEVLREVIRLSQVQVVFQPIVCLQTQEAVGFEALGRGNHEELSSSPVELFRLAEKCKLAPDLSRVFRDVAVQEARQIHGHVSFFFNLHPSEMEDASFVQSLTEAADLFRNNGRRMVVEVHEDAVTNTVAMRHLRDQLREHDIGLAYDDFGAGQSRLAELAEAPPDFIKLDMKLIRGIDAAPARQDLVGLLGRMITRLGVQLIAEGIETPEEASTCLQLGCYFGQGYLFGRPAPAASLAGVTRKVDARALREQWRGKSA